MSSNTAELTLILKAQNLADAEFTKLKTSLQGVAVTAGVVAGDMAAAFKGIGRRIAGQMGNLATDILQGGSITSSLLAVGATMAGGMVEGLSAHFIPGMLAKLGATATFGPIAAALATEGTTLGGVLAAAIPIGMALLPVLIATAAVAALVYLITNPEAAEKAREIGRKIAGWIMEAIHSLPGLIADVVRNALGAAGDAIGNVANQFGGGVGIPGNAAGGWVGLNGPEIVRVGEKGPEFIRPAGTGTGNGGGSGFTIQGVSEAQILDMVDRGLYFRLQRAAVTSSRA